jgi:hypothetical protein
LDIDLYRYGLRRLFRASSKLTEPTSTSGINDLPIGNREREMVSAARCKGGKCRAKAIRHGLARNISSVNINASLEMGIFAGGSDAVPR